jgi:hypothetical protein
VKSAYSFRRAVFEDVYDVAQNSSEIMLAEAEALGLTQWQLLKLLSVQFKAGRAFAITETEQPIAVFGFRKSEERGIYDTWLASSPRFFSTGTVLPIRRILRMIGNRFPGITFRTLTFSPHPQVARWFKLLGYEQRRLFGGAIVYEIKTSTPKVRSGDSPRIA